MKIEPLDATLGAKITDVDLSSLDEKKKDQIRASFLEYSLLIFPDQNLSEDQQVSFGELFGKIEEFGPGVKLVPISNQRKDGSLLQDDEHTTKILRGNEGWHTDSSYMPLAAKASVLSAHVVPAEGGETEWADMRAAYEVLDAEVKVRIAGLSAFHSLYYSQAQIGHDVKEGDGYGFHGGDTPLRPLIKVHPETGKPSLFVGRHAHGIPGLEDGASSQLLDDLVTSACQAPRTYQHQWRPGDIVIWDNRCLLHRAKPYDHNEARVMKHTRIAGDPGSELAA